jgi:hypothetical protein
MPSYTDIKSNLISSQSQEVDYDRNETQWGNITNKPLDMAIHVVIHDSLFCLLEDLENPSASRVFVLMSDFDYTHVWSDYMYDEIESLSTRMEVFTPLFVKINVQMVQKRLFFSSLPDLELDSSISLADSFDLEVSSETTADLGNKGDADIFFQTSTVKLVLSPLELRVSVKDCELFAAVIANLVVNLSSGFASDNDVDEDVGSMFVNDAEPVTVESVPASSTPPPLTRGRSRMIIVEKPVEEIVKSREARLILETAIGDVRFIILSNRLGVPLLNVGMSNLYASFDSHTPPNRIKTIMKGQLPTTACEQLLADVSISSNFWRLSLSHWEPFIEPFKIGMIANGLTKGFNREIFLTVDKPINLTLSPAVVWLLSADGLLSDLEFVTTGSSSQKLAPYRVINKSGLPIRFGKVEGADAAETCAMEVSLSDGGHTSFDFRKQLKSRFKIFGQKQTRRPRSVSRTRIERLEKKADISIEKKVHALLVHQDQSHWRTATAIPFDKLGTWVVPLKSLKVPGRSRDVEGNVQARAPIPRLVATVSLQNDSRLVTLRGQVAVYNHCSIPVDIWIFSPLDNGVVGNYTVDEGASFFVPLNFIHDRMKISIRPSADYGWAPLLNALQEATSVQPVSLLHRVSQSAPQQPSRKVCVCSKLQDEGMRTSWTSEWDGRSAPHEPFPQTSASTIDASAVPPPYLNWCCEFEIKVLEQQNLKAADSVFGRKASIFEVAKDQRTSSIIEGANTVSFQIFPPLMLQNLLAQPMMYSIYTPLIAQKGMREVAGGTLPVGNILRLHQLDMNAKLYLRTRLASFDWSPEFLIHSPSVHTHDRVFLESFLRMQKTAEGRQQHQNDEIPSGPEDGSPVVATLSESENPFLDIVVKREGRQVKIYADLWVVNNTDLPFQFGLHNQFFPSSLSSTQKQRQTRRWSPMKLRQPIDDVAASKESGPIEEALAGDINSYEKDEMAVGREARKKRCVSNFEAVVSSRGSLIGKLERRMSLSNLRQRNIIPTEIEGKGAKSEANKLKLEELLSGKLRSKIDRWRTRISAKKKVKVLLSLPTDRHRFIHVEGATDTVVHDLLLKLGGHLGHAKNHDLRVQDYTFWKGCLPIQHFGDSSSCRLEKISTHQTLSRLLEDDERLCRQEDPILFFQIRSVLEDSFDLPSPGANAAAIVSPIPSDAKYLDRGTEQSLLMMGVKGKTVMGSKSTSQLSMKVAGCNWAPRFTVPSSTSSMQTPPSAVLFQESKATTSCHATGSEAGQVAVHNIFEVGIQFRPAEGIFRNTLILSLSPRYILVNKLNRGIFFRQQNVTSFRHLEAMKHCPFHWCTEVAVPKAPRRGIKNFPHTLQFKFGEHFMQENNQSTTCESWNWSGAVFVDTVGDAAVKMRRAGISNVHCLIRVKVEQVESSLMIIIEPESDRFPPYMIENFTPFLLKYRQTNVAPSTIMGFNLGETLEEAHLTHSEDKEVC